MAEINSCTLIPFDRAILLNVSPDLTVYSDVVGVEAVDAGAVSTPVAPPASTPTPTLASVGGTTASATDNNSPINPPNAPAAAPLNAPLIPCLNASPYDLPDTFAAIIAINPPPMAPTTAPVNCGGMPILIP